jgi:hypothetical protein
MTLSRDLAQHFRDRFRVLILDNEVTVGAFVTDPPLPWARFVATDGIYRIAAGYPTHLTTAEAAREERNWDRVSDSDIQEALRGLDGAADLVVFGNNAGQGLSLAEALPVPIRPRGVVIYGQSLPERPAYEVAAYRQFCRRDELLALVGEAAAAAGRPPALAFINTIEHNERNYHAPWPG